MKMIPIDKYLDTLVSKLLPCIFSRLDDQPSRYQPQAILSVWSKSLKKYFLKKRKKNQVIYTWFLGFRISKFS